MSRLSRIASRLKLRVIENGNGPYLLRHRVWGWMPSDDAKPWSGYLHRFMRPDDDRELHSHPWKWAVSLVLAGGYTEERLKSDGSVVKIRRRPFTLNFLGPNSFHRVDELHGKETWTLFVCGPKIGSWGFMVPGRGVVPWREFLTEKGLKVDY